MKNRHRYHPPTRQEIAEAESRLSKSDQRAIRAGVRAATVGIKGDITETENFALASAVLSNLPASMENLITATRGVADKVLGNDIHTHITLDLFGGDAVKANKAIKEYEGVVWYLNEVYDADILQQNSMGESMLRNLSPDAKVVVKEVAGVCFDGKRAAYVMNLIG